MKENKDQIVTVRFESTLENRENDNIETLLLSGPIEIFATLDVIHTEYIENGSKKVIAHPTKSEMESDKYKITQYDVDNQVYPDLIDDDIGYFSIEKFAHLFGDEISLESPYVTNLIYGYYVQTKKHPIVYVERVTNYKDQYRNRGAYFRLESVSVKDGEPNLAWREILLGTHSHSNINDLEKLYELSKQDGANGKVISLDENGNFCLKEIESIKGVPELPPDIKKRLDDIEDYNKLNEPAEYEWNHLDAPLDQLDNSYDWLEKDEDGNYKNLAVGNCRELYRNLLISEEKLYISNDYKLADEGKYWISLDVYKVNFDTSKTYEDAVNVKVSPIESRFLVASFELSSMLAPTDEVFLINNGVMLSDYHYSLEKNQKNINILFNRNVDQFKDITTLTVLVVKDVDVKGFRTLLKMAFDSNDISLIEINNRLTEKYIRNEFAKRPLLPKLYLSTDEYGNIVWDNKLLPTQTFYAKTARINISNIQKVEHNGRACAEIVFENANYRVGEDFPLLMVNDFFVFGVQPEVSEKSSKDLIYYLPISPDPGEGHYDFELIESTDYRDVTLVLIKNSSAGSIADEIAEKYISKEDAVAILSHGKINLKDFAKKTDLLKFSKLDHTHSQYALKDHNHDARYANFHHTHPEILLAVARETGIEVNKIDSWISSLEEKTSAELKAVLEEIGVRRDVLGKDDLGNEIYSDYYIEDVSVRLVENTESMLREFSGKYNIPVPLTEVGLTVKDALEVILRAFEIDTVTDSQVILEGDIPVKLVNGAIGGLTHNKTYKAGVDSLQTILRDILNPYINIDKMRELLTPTTEHTEVEWFVLDSSGTPYKIDLNHAPYFNEPKMLLFTVKLNNAMNEYCKTTITVNNLESDLYAEIHDIKVTGETCRVYTADDYSFNKKYFIYSDSFEFDKDNYLNVPNLEILYKSNLNNDKIYDNYGMSPSEGDNEFTRLNPEDKYLNIELNVKVDYPDFFYGQTNSYKDIERELQLETNEGSDSVWSMIGSELHDFNINTSNGKCIFFAIEKTLYNNIKIFDCNSHTNVTRFFNEIDEEVLLFNGIAYIITYYESFESDTELCLSLKLQNTNN